MKTRKSPRPSPEPPADPAALPFLPLLYVAWSDGDLTPDEIAKIRERVAAAPDLSPDARQELLEWLQPDQPPRPVALRALLSFLQERAAELPDERRRSLAKLGENVSGGEVTPETRAALNAIEDALGVVGEEAARDLTPGQEAAGVRPEASFDPAAIQRLFDGDRKALRDQIRELLSGPLFRHQTGLSKEQRRERVFEQLQVIADAGLGSLSYPEEAGGQADMKSFAVAFEMLGFGDGSLTIKYGVQFGLFGGAIRMLGTPERHGDLLRRAGTLELPGCFAMTERGHGSNVFDIETTAEFDPEAQEFVIHTPNDPAHKDYIGNAALHGRMAVVFAQLIVGGERHGVHALLAPIRDENGEPAPGVRIEDCGDKLGLNGIDNGQLWFDRVRVPRTNLLNRYADVTPEGEYASPIASASKRFFTMLGALVAGRVSVALASLSAMKTGLTIAVRYSDRRRQFGPAGAQEVLILDYLTHQRRLLPYVATAYALDFGLKYLTERFVGGSEDDQREVEALAAGFKAYATWMNRDALVEAREACGGRGYMAENRFADLKADTDVYCTFEGDNTVLYQLLVKSLLSEYKRQFEDARPFTMLKFVAKRAADAVGEPSPVAARTTDAEHLRGASFQLDAMRYRERRLVGSLARRLRHRLSDDMDSFFAFIEVQDHMLAAARAHVERLLLETFVDAVEACGDPPARDALDRQRSLFGLWRIETDRAWFLEAGYVTAAKSRAIREQVNELCGEIRPEATALVDAFGIPDAVLAAPIGLREPTD